MFLFIKYAKKAAEKKAEEIEDGEGNVDDYRPGFLRRCIVWLCQGTLGRLGIFEEGSYANAVFVNILGFISGLILTTFFYAFFIFKLDCGIIYAALLAAILGALLCFGLAFSSPVRCMTLLMIPQLFSSTGRIVLLAYGMLLVMSGPMANLNHNLSVASKSQACGSSLAFNQSQQVFDMATAPLTSVIDSVENVLESMQDIVQEVKTSFEAIADAISAVGDAVQEAVDWLHSIVDVCNERMGAPEAMCREKFKNAEKDCKKKLGSILGLACNIISLVENICAVAGIAKLFCLIPAAIVKLVVGTITTGCIMVLDDLEKEFYVDFDLSHNFTVNNDVSKTVSEITEGISQEIEQRTRVFRMVLAWASRGLALTLIWLFLKAYFYRRSYLIKDKFDNCYVTSLFVEMDDRRRSMNKEALLPLRRSEKSNYIKPSSMKLAKMEKINMLTGLLLWCSQCLWVALIISADYGAHWLLHMIRLNAAVNTQSQNPHQVNMQVEGEGLLADLYREVITSFDPMSGKNFSIDTTRCLPNPEPPDMAAYRTIGSIYGICLSLVLTEAYGLRLRRLVASYYYKERERQRIAWLYGHIQKRRGGFLRYLRRQIRRNSKSLPQAPKITLTDRLAVMCPLFEKVLQMCGVKKKYCLGCSQSGDTSDTENFKHCVFPGCQGVYCLECFADLNNICTLCMKPVDYGDFSDFSEERDSSEDEELEPLLVKSDRDDRDAAEVSNDVADARSDATEVSDDGTQDGGDYVNDGGESSDSSESTSGRE